MTHVAVLDQFHPAVRAIIEARLPAGWAAGFAASRAMDEQARVLAGAEVVLLMAAPVTRAHIAAAPRLRFIQKLGAGTDRIDIEACRERGIAVARLSAGNAIQVAEHTVMLMLACLRRLPELDRRTRAGEWLKEQGRGINRQLAGKRVGLIGFGAIGRAVAEALTGFGVEIVYYDPQPAAAEVEKELAVRRLGLDELIATSDIVSLHLPLTPATRNLVSTERIARMKPGAVLVNCARGGLVDEAALHRALADGHLLAAGLDTFASEPPVASPLLALANTVVTPHLAGATIDNFAAVLARGIANAERFLAGRGLPEGDAVLVPPTRPARDER